MFVFSQSLAPRASCLKGHILANGDKRDYYEVLGVNRNASDTEIKKAYRTQARKNHPDVNPGDKQAETRFKEIQAAYDVLSDTEKRALYDRYGKAAFEGAAAAGPRGNMIISCN